MAIQFEEEKSGGIHFEPEAEPKQDSVHKGVIDRLDVEPEQTAALHLFNPVGMGKTLMGVGDGLATAAADIPDTLKKRGWSAASLQHLLKRYQQGHAEGQGAYDAATEKNPKSAIAGDVANAIGTGLVAGPAASGLTKMQKAGRAIPLAASYGFGNSSADVTKGAGDVGKLAVDTGVGAATGAALANVPARTLIGGGVGAYAAKDDLAQGNFKTAAAKIGGGAALMHLAPKAGRFAKSAVGNALGVNKDALDDYLARSKEINASPTKSQVKDAIDTVVTTARDDLQAAKQAVRDRAMDHRQDVRQALQRAEDALERASAQKTQDTAAEVETATETLKGLLVQGSKTATEAIPTVKNAAPGTVPDVGAIPTRELKRQLSKRINRLSPMGPEAGPPPGGAAASAGRLQQWKDWMEKLPQNLTYEDAKPLIQRLDQASKEFYGKAPGEFAPEEQVAIARLRQLIDKKLKAGVPEYEQRMVPVAEDAKLLSGTRENLGAGQQLVARLRRLRGEPQGGPVGETVDALGRRTGKDFRGMMGTPTEEAAVASARDAATPKQVAQTIGGSPEAQRLAQTSRDNSGVMRVGRNGEALIDRMVTGKENPVAPKINDQETVNALTQKLPELPSWLKNLKTLNAFTGERTHGARNAVRFGAAGAAVGGAMGHPYEGAAAGSAIGGVVDKFGPKIAKAGLDTYIPARDKASEVIAKLSASPITQKFAQSLQQAKAKSGDQGFAARYFLLQSMYPEMKRAIHGDENQE